MTSEVAQILEHKRTIMQEKGAQPKRCAALHASCVNAQISDGGRNACASGGLVVCAATFSRLTSM